jgi:hypothetical protein
MRNRRPRSPSGVISVILAEEAGFDTGWPDFPGVYAHRLFDGMAFGRLTRAYWPPARASFRAALPN